MASLSCDIVTPDSKLYSGEAKMVVVPGVEGEMGFLAGHVPLVSALADGAVRVTLEGKDEVLSFVCQGGYVEVNGEKVIVLANRALNVTDIDVAKTTEMLESLEAQLEGMSKEEAGKTTLAADIAWSRALLNAAK